jgi:hypothetical protein
MSTEYRNIVQACATQGQATAQRLAAKGNPQRLYLYARTSQPNMPGRLFLCQGDRPPPEGYDLVTPEGLRSDAPYENFFTWIYDRARRAPVMAID